MNVEELKKIEKKFNKVKSIHCLKLDKEVDVTNVPRLQYNPDEDTVTSPSRIICFWKEGEFAKVVQ
ncbi:hypothetical protein HX063_17265 [Myroides odoratimimus]|uniref:hypothetical protein n=1 Tax=Myroides odoratimimus TaxID=76832 RepID=UPI002575EC6F|nr:hypothetical protein [Myroides odoratimimus]MDM1497120.1 hypothetical protein [Myroides odoratimimus]